jgi:hypothetical protein
MIVRVLCVFLVAWMPPSLFMIAASYPPT